MKKFFSLLHFFIFTIIFIVIINVGLTFGDIYCFCNTANCIRNGYTCLSSGEYASCYTEIDDKQNHFNVYKHGCIEHLSELNQLLCQKHVNKSNHHHHSNNEQQQQQQRVHQKHHHYHKQQPHQHVDSADDDDNLNKNNEAKLINQYRKDKLFYLRLNERKLFNRDNDYNNNNNNNHNNENNNKRRLRRENKKKIICCKDDMCNYSSNIEMNLKLQSKINSNQKEPSIVSKENRKQQQQKESNAYESDLWWFNMAVIIVPIVGGILLVILILFAAQVLRQDRKRQRYLNDLYRRNNLLQSEFIFYNNYLLNINNSNNQSNNSDDDNNNIEESYKYENQKNNYQCYLNYYNCFSPVNEKNSTNFINNSDYNLNKEIKQMPFKKSKHLKIKNNYENNKQLQPFLTSSSSSSPKSTAIVLSSCSPSAETAAATTIKITSNVNDEKEENAFIALFISKFNRLFNFKKDLNNLNISSQEKN